MATISEAEILKAAAEASLMSASAMDSIASVSQALVGASTSTGIIGQPYSSHMNIPTAEVMAGTSQGLEDAEYANVPTVSENTTVRSSFEVGGKVYDNVEALLAAHLMACDEGTAQMKEEIDTSFDGSFKNYVEGVTYKVLRGATKRGHDKLVDSLGFSYTMKNTKRKSSSGTVYWWCTVRNSNCKCPAIVKQFGDTFTRGKWKHEHLVGLNKSTLYQQTPSKRGKKEIIEKQTVQDKTKVENRAPDYVIIKEGSKAGMDLLKDRFGYTYTMRKVNKLSDKCTWICSIRNKHLRCPASVYQTGTHFRPGEVSHKHLPTEKTEKPAEVVAAYMEAFIKNRQGDDVIDSEDDNDFDDDVYEEEEDDDDDIYDYGDTTPGTFVRTEKNKNQGRKEHPTFLGPTCTINLTKCENPGCNCKLVHCPFCDKDHFKPAKPARVQDHLEMSHFAHGVQFDDYMIVKCFKDCGQKKIGHYHCVFCKEQIIKRTAYGRHLSRHMKKKGIPTNILILPDSKFPDTINAYGYEIPICKKDCKSSEGKHFHCPKCKRICRERSVTVNHVWRCLQAEKMPTEDDSIDIDDAEDYELEESLLKDHFSIVKNFKDLSMEQCQEPSCCRNMYHCQLCPPKVYRPTYKQQLIVHYITHWKTRVPYKNYNILRCFHACLDPRLPPIKIRYHYHCPLCAKMLRQRNTFQDHLSYCHYISTGESMTINGVNDHAQDMAKITEELTPLIDNVDYMEDVLTMEAKLSQALKMVGSPRRGSRTRQSLATVKQDSDDDGDESLDDDNGDENVEEDDVPETPTTTVHEEFLKHLTAKKSSYVFKDITKDLKTAAPEEKRDLKKKQKAQNLDISMIFDTASAILSDTLISSFKKESSLKACLSIVTERTETKVIHSEFGGKKTYMLTGKMEDLNVAQQLLVQLSLPTEKSHSFARYTQTKKARAVSVKKEIEESSDDNQSEEVHEKGIVKRKPESYNQKMARIKKEKEAHKKKAAATKGKTLAPKSKQGNKKTKGKNQETSDNDDSFPYSEIKEIIAASKEVDQKGKRGRPPKKGKSSSELISATPPKSSSHGRPVSQTKVTPSGTKKRTPVSQAMKTPKVDLKTIKLGQKPVKSPSRYSTRGARVDYQKMNAGQVVIKEEVFSDVEEPIIESEIENSKIESDSEQPIKRKRGRPPKNRKMQTKGGTVMYKPRTDSEISEHEDVTENSENEEVEDDGNIDDDDADDYISDLDEVDTSIQDEVDNENPMKSDSSSEMEESDDEPTKLAKDTDPKVTVQVIPTGSPVKIWSAAINVDGVPDVKGFSSVSPKKGKVDNLKDSDKDGAGNRKGKIVASVPSINNKDARKVSFISRKRTCQDEVQKDVVKKQKTSASEIIEQAEDTCDSVEKEPLIAKPDSEKLNCSLCDFVAEMFSGLTEHLIQKHNIVDPPRCDICEIDFASSRQVQIHLDKQHGPQAEVKRYKCGACESIFNTQKLCEAHIRRVHLQSEKESGPSKKGQKYSCEKCEFTSSAAQEFHDHMKLKHDVDIVCNLCSKPFSNLSNLKLHKESVHFKNKKASCEICSKEFSHVRYLKNHMETHRQFGRFECSQCKRRFTAKASLVAHIETHKAPEDREYKFVCSYCGKKFTYKSNYEDHLNKHTGAKPYSCKICGKTFGFRSMLVKHKVYIHSQERPFSCGRCHKAFKFRRLLENHMTTHTLQSKHVCSKCSKNFTTSSSLKVHEQKCMGISKQIPPVAKSSTLILHIDGKPTVYHLGSTGAQTMSTAAGTMMDQILTDVMPQQTTQIFAPPMIAESSGDGLVLTDTQSLTDQQAALESLNLSNEETEFATQEQPREGQVFMCSECNATFGSLDDAQTHILTVHSEQAIA